MLRALSILLVAIFITNPSKAVDCAAPAPGSCSLLKGQQAVFVGLLVNKGERLRFRIEEHIKGAKGDYFEMDELIDGSSYFETGKRYLVFVSPEYNGRSFAAACGPTRELKYAAAILKQVRAERGGKRDASLYGTLFRASNFPDQSGEYRAPLARTTVRVLGSDGRSFAAETDEQGAYAFESLPTATYRISAQLPSDLELADPVSHKPPESFVLSSRSCFDNDITAMPTGEISGHVVGPDGLALESTSVNLYAAEHYSPSQEGEYAYQGASKPFLFRGLPSGDYILVFNRADWPNPDAPFPRTFYPGVQDFTKAKVIHLEDAQHLANADIHLPQASMQTRKLRINLVWDGLNAKDYYKPQIVVQPSKGASGYPWETGKDHFTLNLLMTAKYTLQAQAFCKDLQSRGETQTDKILVDGNDSAISEVTLTFRKGDCNTKRGK